jgi:hypothetical protein
MTQLTELKFEIFPLLDNFYEEKLPLVMFGQKKCWLTVHGLLRYETFEEDLHPCISHRNFGLGARPQAVSYRNIGSISGFEEEAFSTIPILLSKIRKPDQTIEVRKIYATKAELNSQEQ